MFSLSRVIQDLPADGWLPAGRTASAAAGESDLNGLPRSCRRCLSVECVYSYPRHPRPGQDSEAKIWGLDPENISAGETLSVVPGDNLRPQADRASSLQPRSQ